MLLWLPGSEQLLDDDHHLDVDNHNYDYDFRALHLRWIAMRVVRIRDLRVPLR